MTRRPRRRRRPRHPAIEGIVALFEKPLVRLLTVALVPSASVGAIGTGQLIQAHREIEAVRDTVGMVADTSAARDSTARLSRRRLRHSFDSLLVVVRDHDYRILKLEHALELTQASMIGPPIPRSRRRGRSGPP